MPISVDHTGCRFRRTCVVFIPSALTFSSTRTSSKASCWVRPVFLGLPLQNLPTDRSHHRFVCNLPSSEQKEQSSNNNVSPGLNSPYYVTYTSWRDPKWLRAAAEQGGPGLPEISWSYLRSGWENPFRVPRKELPLRLTCSVALLTALGLLTFSYLHLNIVMQTAIQDAALVALNREVHVGRVVRCNPITGIRLLDVSLPVSPQNPTAPAVSAASADVYLSGFLRTIFLRKPLKVNLHLDDAEVRVSQRVVQGPKGEPLGQWDPGVYPTEGESGIDPDSAKLITKVLQLLQPGELIIRNARVFLTPADFLDYGHGSEIIEFENASASVTFPHLTLKDEAASYVECDGNFTARVKGKPADGGWIDVETTLKGESLSDLKPEDEIVSLRVRGGGVKANRVASFLSLPFRADDGVCGADISMDFLYKSASLVPLMRGDAQLDSVALRFHPDPKTPEFRHIDGKLRFEGKTLFLDGPSGELGTLPMTVVGSIHLEDGYNLMGYIRPVDVNNIINTFEVEKFVPVTGLVSGEAQLSGALEEPVISGWAESVGEGGVFDRLPLKNATTTFEWDAIAGLLKFPEINASVKGGGSVSGSGSLYFDMTKENEYGIRQQVHSPRSPKAVYWNPDRSSSNVPQLPPLPEDELEIDEHAPSRPYDSMRFDFKVDDVNGGDLLDFYGGVYGKMAVKTIGKVSGEGILAGHAKDANCRVTWRSTTPPPEVKLSTHDPSSNSTQANHEVVKSDDPPQNKDGGMKKAGSYLGGGDFRGLVYLKLGDLPEARRVKVRTVVENLDARRCGWADPAFQRILSHTPLLNVSTDSYFKGVMFQRPVLLPSQVQNPRTPRMELLGADGALAVKTLTLNKVRFDHIMSGSFSFSASDFSMSIKEVDKHKREPRTSSQSPNVFLETLTTNDDDTGKDELTVAASLKGQAHFCFRLKDSEIVASVSKDEQNHRVAGLFARNVIVQDFVGADRSFSNVEALSGTVNADANIDLTSRVGEGNVAIAKPRVGPLNFSSVQGKVVWRDQDLFLERGTVKYRRSEYHIDGHYSYDNVDEPEFGWEVNVSIPRASIQDVAQLISSGNAVATAMQSSADRIASGGTRPSEGPTWLQKLSQSSGEGESILVEEWKIPEELSLREQLEWFQQYVEEEKSIRRSKRLKKIDAPTASRDRSFPNVSGDLTGRVNVSYNSRVGEKKLGPSNATAFLRAILDQLTRTSFSFQLAGENWRVGPARIREVGASGTFEDGVLSLERLAFDGNDDFGVEARGRISNSGSVNASAFLRQAPAGLLNEYSRAPVQVTGTCNARLEVEGNLSNPRAFGRVVWTDATLNGKRVQGAKTDVACINGRCILNADAAISNSRNPKQELSDKAAIESLNWGDTVVAGLHNLASQVSDNPEGPFPVSRRSSKKGEDDSLQVRISAPVRFYLLNYLQRQAPRSFWSEVEPVLGGSLPSDDEWILMDVDVKKFGLILLNTALPELGWDGGESDIRLRVSGTLQDPIVKGRVSVSDGKLAPAFISEPVQSIRGEIQFTENGLMSLKSISGKCSGRTFSLNGNLFLSEEHRERLVTTKLNNEVVLDRLKPNNAQTRRTRRLLMANQREVESALQKGSRGVQMDFGDVPINVHDMVISKLSGKLHTEGTVIKPVVSGSVTLGDGVIFLTTAGNPLRQMNPKNGNNALMDMLEKKQPQPTNSAQQRQKPRKPKFENNVLKQTYNGKAPGEVNTSSDQDVVLRRLQIKIGKNVQVVQPFVLNVDTAGSVLLDGPVTSPEVTGEVKLLRGNINMLATRMSIRKDEDNYVKFVKADVNNKAEKHKMPDPVIKLAMEDQNLLVRIAECTMKTWHSNIEVSDKSGDRISASKFVQLLGEQLENIRNREAAQKVLAGYVMRSISTGGKVGGLEWRVYPDLVSQTGGILKGRLRDELGVGATFEYGGLSVSSSTSLDGSVSGSFRIRLWDWLTLESETEGVKQDLRLKLNMPTSWKANGNGKKGDTSEVQDSIMDDEARFEAIVQDILQGKYPGSNSDHDKRSADDKNENSDPKEERLSTSRQQDISKDDLQSGDEVKPIKEGNG